MLRIGIKRRNLLQVLAACVLLAVLVNVPNVQISFLNEKMRKSNKNTSKEEPNKSPATSIIMDFIEEQNRDINPFCGYKV